MLSQFRSSIICLAKWLNVASRSITYVTSNECGKCRHPALIAEHCIVQERAISTCRHSDQGVSYKMKMKERVINESCKFDMLVHDFFPPNKKIVSQHLLEELDTSRALGPVSYDECNVPAVLHTDIDTIHVLNEDSVTSAAGCNVISRENHSVTVMCVPVENVDDSIAEYSSGEREMAKNQAPVPDPLGKPTLEQLTVLQEKLHDTIKKIFVSTHDYSLYHKNVIFENNFTGKVYRGIVSYMQQVALFRIWGHVRYAHIHIEILKSTVHEEDGTIRVRWRLKGIGGIRAILTFWRFKIWKIRQSADEQSSWLDGFSIFYLKGDGLIHKHVADRMMREEEKTKKRSFSRWLFGVKPLKKSLAPS